MKLSTSSPSFGSETTASRDCSSASSEELLVFHDSNDNHEAFDVSLEFASDGEESSSSSDGTGFNWARHTHSPLPVFETDYRISPQEEAASFRNLSPASSEESGTLNTEGLETNAGVSSRDV